MSEPASLPSRIGPYEIVAPLGVGGMGHVYRARDSRLGRMVALKLLPADIARDPNRRYRFEREARAAGSLNHKNIVHLFDFGNEDGILYLVSELVVGEPLGAIVAQGPMAVGWLIDLARQIAGALVAAHAAGIVHRDLKPDNIMVTADGRVKVLDFGLAKQLSADAAGTPDATLTVARTQPGEVMGTVGYMSPEQVLGKAADHRSDIFSLGVVLYEMATGKQAFHRGSFISTMDAVLNSTPPALPASLPPALDLIVRRCIEKDPAARFPSAKEVSFALELLASMSGV